MPRISSIELLGLREQPVLFIRTRTKMEELPRLIGESYGRLAAYLAEQGELLTDVPYTAYHNMDMADLDVEMGFPIARILPGQGDIQSAMLPQGKAAFCMYQGAYMDIGPVYEEMAGWIKEKGCEMEGSSYEYYYNDTQYPESVLLTKLILPIK